ncbi:tyramine/octopamine receptor-like isoform X2 [Plodia interpunctella]|uniref:tyramine/octopamine receptor-like isoform X2 n=1 Tax=Plodia interpunctella TaxID=58824 RepID=UPI002367A0B8|nr:tyramine/octopamine receptor-like isoform X2 [Plodia interpunctella]
MNIQTRGEITPAWCAAATAMLLITVTTITGNTAVVTALRRLRRTPAHYPLASLAAADLLVGTFVLPIAVARELFIFQLNWALCSCWSTLDVLCCTASILSLCALGWERWCCITAPLARAQRIKRAKLYAMLIWPVSTAVALPTAFIPSPKHYLTGEVAKACTVNTNVGYVFFSTTFSFYLPATIMVTFYVRILRLLAVPPTIRAHRGRQNQIIDAESKSPVKTHEFKAKKPRTTEFTTPQKHRLQIPVGSSNDQISSPKKTPNSPGGLVPRQRRATRTIIMLMSLFMACWLPFFVMLPVDSLCECVWDTFWQWCTWLGYANSAINPLVYAAASPSVRRALHASLTSSSSSGTRTVLSPSMRRP